MTLPGSPLQLYAAATGGRSQADAVSAAVAALLELDRVGQGSGNARLLRRRLLERCEKAFDLSPPPGEDCTLLHRAGRCLEGCHHNETGGSRSARSGAGIERGGGEESRMTAEALGAHP